MVVDTLFCNDRRNYFYRIYRTMTTMKKKTKNKKVNVTQTVVVNVGKGRRNVKPKVQAPLVQAPIVSQQVASQALGISPALNYHQMVYGNLPVPQMANVPGSYYGMISPFNKPLHVVSEVQQAQLRQANELAGQNVTEGSRSAFIAGGKGVGTSPNPLGKGYSLQPNGEQIKDSLGSLDRSLNPALSLGKQEAQSVSFKQHAEEPIKQPMSPRVNAEAASSSSSAAASSSQQNLIDALAAIEKSSGVRGNEKPIQGQMTKNQLITMVKSVTGQVFAPSASADYARIKRSAITFITDILKKKQRE